MYRILLSLLLISALISCGRDTGKIQSELQSIFLAINNGQLEEANDMLVADNKLSATPLESDGYTKELYGQVYILNTYDIGDHDQMIIYKLEKHERNRGVQHRMSSEDFKERKQAGQVKSVNEESGVIVYSERRLAFRVKEEDGEYRYIIEPTTKAINAAFYPNQEHVQRMIKRHFIQG